MQVASINNTIQWVDYSIWTTLFTELFLFQREKTTKLDSVKMQDASEIGPAYVVMQLEEIFS